MKKIKIVVSNRAPCILHMEYQCCGCSEIEKLRIRRRKVLSLTPDHYIFSLGYEGMNLQLTSALTGIKDEEIVASIGDSKVMGVRLLVNNLQKRMKLKCDGTPAVSAIIENLS